MGAEEIEKEQAEKEERERKQKEEEEAPKKEPEAFKDPMDAMNKAKQTIDLSEIPEGSDEVKKENIGTRKLLDGFKFLNVKIHLLTDSLDKIYQKQRYQNLFDVGVLSVASAIHMKDAEMKSVFKKNAKVHLELCD